MYRSIYSWTYLFLLICLSASLAACTTDQLPLTSAIEVQITQVGCHPTEWRVPAGQLISLKISNKANQDYTWIFMGRPVTPPFDAADTANVFFTHPISARATISVQFKTPQAAGEYQVFCTPSAHFSEDQAGRITVVQP
jgi:plastocyanin